MPKTIKIIEIIFKINILFFLGLNALFFSNSELEYFSFSIEMWEFILLLYIGLFIFIVAISQKLRKFHLRLLQDKKRFKFYSLLLLRLLMYQFLIFAVLILSGNSYTYVITILAFITYILLFRIGLFSNRKYV